MRRVATNADLTNNRILELAYERGTVKYLRVECLKCHRVRVLQAATVARDNYCDKCRREHPMYRGTIVLTRRSE